MKYIEKFGMHLSRIGLGTGRFGTLVDENASFEMLDVFLSYGGNVIDTARNYYEWVENGRGISEQTIGKWMASRSNRPKVYIATKGGVRNEGRCFFINLSRENLLNDLASSQEALQSKKIDIYLLHRDEPNRPVEEIMDSMQVISETAEVNALGVCNWSAQRIIAANKYAQSMGYKPISMIQTWWSIAAYTDAMWNDPTTTHMDEETYAYIKENDLIGMAFTSQAKGFFQKAATVGIDALDDFLKKRIATTANLKRLECILEYCKDKNCSPTAVVNGYITSNPVDGIALVSCSRSKQLLDILDNCDVNIDKDFIMNIERIL